MPGSGPVLETGISLGTGRGLEGAGERRVAEQEPGGASQAWGDERFEYPRSPDGSPLKPHVVYHLASPGAGE